MRCAADGRSLFASTYPTPCRRRPSLSAQADKRQTLPASAEDPNCVERRAAHGRSKGLAAPQHSRYVERQAVAQRGQFGSGTAHSSVFVTCA